MKGVAMDGAELLREASAAMLGAALLIASWCDLLWRIIPNECVACAAVAWLVDCGVGANVAGEVLWGLAGGALVLLLLLASARMGVALGRGPGIGGGDVKLLSVAGLWGGPVWGLAMVAASCLLGVVAHALRSLAGGTAFWREGIPLGPAIAVCLASFSLLRP